VPDQGHAQVNLAFHTTLKVRRYILDANCNASCYIISSKNYVCTILG
jgi:hypothetical protein